MLLLNMNAICTRVRTHSTLNHKCKYTLQFNLSCFHRCQHHYLFRSVTLTKRYNICESKTKYTSIIIIVAKTTRTLPHMPCNFRLWIADWHELKCIVTLRIRNLFVLLHYVYRRKTIDWVLTVWAIVCTNHGMPPKQIGNRTKSSRFIWTFLLVTSSIKNWR